jgi:hypothetical protein
LAELSGGGLSGRSGKNGFKEETLGESDCGRKSIGVSILSMTPDERGFGTGAGEIGRSGGAGLESDNVL